MNWNFKIAFLNTSHQIDSLLNLKEYYGTNISFVIIYDKFNIIEKKTIKRKFKKIYYSRTYLGHLFFLLLSLFANEIFLGMIKSRWIKIIRLIRYPFKSKICFIDDGLGSFTYQSLIQKNETLYTKYNVNIPHKKLNFTLPKKPNIINEVWFLGSPFEETGIQFDLVLDEIRKIEKKFKLDKYIAHPREPERHLKDIKFSRFEKTTIEEFCISKNVVPRVVITAFSGGIIFFSQMGNVETYYINLNQVKKQTVNLVYEYFEQNNLKKLYWASFFSSKK